MINKFKFERYREEEDQYGSEGSGSDSYDGGGDSSLDTGGGDSYSTGVAQPASKTYTLEEIQAIRGSAPQQAPQEPQMTQEQINEMLKVYAPTDKTVDAMFGDNSTPESRLQALQEIVQGVVTHLTTTVGYANQLMSQNFQQQFSPAMEMVEQQKRQAFTSELTGKFPSLKGRENVINMAIDQVKRELNGRPINDINVASQMVAARAEQIIRQVDSSFALANQPGQHSSQGGMPRMASLPAGSGGGAHGSANGGSHNKKEPAWKSIF